MIELCVGSYRQSALRACNTIQNWHSCFIVDKKSIDFHIKIGALEISYTN
jgi:hypothetical protein